jgi:hypothetical protein
MKRLFFIGVCSLSSAAAMAQAAAEAVEDVSTLNHKILFALGLSVCWIAGFFTGKQP